MNILITGSSGLIGGALARRLVADGSSVVRLVRTPLPPPAGSGLVSGTGSGPTGGADGSIRQVRWDPPAGTVDHRALAACGPIDGVVHLAGAGIGDHRWNEARKAEILRSRVESTRLLVDTLVRLDPHPGVLVSGSAIGFYGDGGDRPLTEGSPRSRGFLPDVCDAWERAAAPAAESGIRTVMLRTGVVLSRSGGALAKQLPLFRLGLGGRLGPGTQYQSWITLDDEVAVICRALVDNTLDGPVNATAPVPVTNAELTRAIGRALRRPAMLAVPATALRLALGRQMADELLLTSQLVLPQRLDAAGFEFGSRTVDAALAVVLDGSAGSGRRPPV